MPRIRASSTSSRCVRRPSSTTSSHALRNLSLIAVTCRRHSITFCCIHIRARTICIVAKSDRAECSCCGFFSVASVRSTRRSPATSCPRCQTAVWSFSSRAMPRVSSTSTLASAAPASPRVWSSESMSTSGFDIRTLSPRPEVEPSASIELLKRAARASGCQRRWDDEMTGGGGGDGGGDGGGLEVSALGALITARPRSIACLSSASACALAARST